MSSAMKRTWVLPVIGGLLSPLIFYESLRTIYYITPVSFISCGMMMYLCPYFCNYLFKRPLYYGDLIDRYAPGDAAHKYQKYFTYINGFLSAVLFVGLVDYVVFRYRYTSLDYFEALGVIGGVIELYKKWQLFIGKHVMKLLYKCKETSERKRKMSEDLGDIQIIELDEVKVDS